MLTHASLTDCLLAGTLSLCVRKSVSVYTEYSCTYVMNNVQRNVIWTLLWLYTKNRQLSSQLSPVVGNKVSYSTAATKNLKKGLAAARHKGQILLEGSTDWWSFSQRSVCLRWNPRAFFRSLVQIAGSMQTCHNRWGTTQHILSCRGAWLLSNTAYSKQALYFIHKR